ncbi:helix-turn-helix domain-containing protein [Arthrobacter sp. NPDC058288]|uniref:helix-turn-helix domain-containing protein n=1 Tax=Arthrobacter sp. NPDC058288 TaxID=3346424 RepID=UPI0036EF7F93
MNTSPTQTDNAPDAEIADKIMNTLIVRGTNQKELARGVGISYTTLRRSLHQERHDRRSLTIQELGKIAHALNVPPSALLPDALTRSSV